MIKAQNIHTHSNFSDGLLSPELLIYFARRNHSTILGIFDHAFSTKLPDYLQIISLNQFITYGEEKAEELLTKYLHHLSLLNAKYSGLHLLKGIEIDVSKKNGINPSILPFYILNKFDYLLFEYVYDLHRDTLDNRCTIDDIVAIRKKITIPVGLAYNDIQLNWGGHEELIAAILGKNDIFVELNQHEQGNQRDNKHYYHLFSKDLLSAFKQNNVKFVIGSDCHGKDIFFIDDAMDFMREYNLPVHPLISSLYTQDIHTSRLTP
jgi:histidinol phosphatase-like PHP family hydrolase